MILQSPKLVVIFCRGGIDGLSLIGCMDSEPLRKLRPDLRPQTSLSLVDGFAFHPALKTLHALFASRDLVFMHAAGLPFRDRSHFKSQDMFESGIDAPHPATGWLGRAMSVLPVSVQAVAIGSTLPLILRGAPDSFNWSDPALNPDDEPLLAALKSQLYSDHSVFSKAIDQIDDLRPFLGSGKRRTRRSPFQIVGEMLANDEGPDIGVISLSGWDTHDKQASRLDKLFSDLDAGVSELRDSLADANDETVIVIASEFGRSVAQNGTRGTDHGTGGAVIVAGGPIAGGARLGSWPGLTPEALFSGRDLYPQNDIRDVFAVILNAHFGLSHEAITRTVFPGITRAYQSLPLFVQDKDGMA